MDLALYHPEFGYYARAAQRSGRAGDFFTSVDVGPIFGELLARQIVEMAAILGSPPRAFDLVEAGAGNGRLSADILRALDATAPCPAAAAAPAPRRGQRRAHAPRRPDTLGAHASRLTSASGDLPERFEGVLFANELLDAMPVHQVVMHEDGLREVFVVEDRGRLTAREGAAVDAGAGRVPGRARRRARARLARRRSTCARATGCPRPPGGSPAGS